MNDSMNRTESPEHIRTLINNTNRSIELVKNQIILSGESEIDLTFLKHEENELAELNEKYPEYFI